MMALEFSRFVEEAVVLCAAYFRDEAAEFGGLTGWDSR